MSERPAPAAIQAILLDIEGTTTPMAFVFEVLFPHARTRLRSHVEQHAASPDYQRLFDRFRDEHAAEKATADQPLPPWVDAPPSARLASVVSYSAWLMNRNSKSTALKDLQGRIWEEGYRGGELVGQVFPDVPGALERWHAEHVRIAIFSSGSVLAQELLFRHSSAGDLTRFIQRYFDTAMGPKRDSDSYRGIVAAMAIRARDVLFVSDITAELDAARTAGMQMRLALRPGNTPQPDAHVYTAIRTFDEIPC